jgi:hypothetical protein
MPAICKAAGNSLVAALPGSSANTGELASIATKAICTHAFFIVDTFPCKMRETEKSHVTLYAKNSTTFVHPIRGLKACV